MATIPFDLALFRSQFPQFSSTDDTTVGMYWDMGTSYVSNNSSWAFSGSAQIVALNLMAAHLLASMQLLADGGSVGVITSSSIDKVSVSIAPPPSQNAWRYWLNTTPYGQQLVALLSMQAVGGGYCGAAPERLAFRKAGGVF